MSPRWLASRLLFSWETAKEILKFARTCGCGALSERDMCSQVQLLLTRLTFVRPNVRKWKTAKPILCSGHNAHLYFAGGSHGRQELANPGIVRRQISWRHRDRYGMQRFDAALWEAPGDSILAKAAAIGTLSDPDGACC